MSPHPSDLKRIYTGCVARGEKLPVTFTVGAHPLDFFAATTRQGGDELKLVANFRGEPAPVVKSLTNDILVPADAEMTLEGYLDERGYVEPEGPFGEYMGYYGAIHMDPVFHCTAITMRSDVLHHTLLHGSAFLLDQTDSANISAMRTEAEAMRILKNTVREPVAVYLRSISGGVQHAARLHQATLLWRGQAGDRGAVRRHHATKARLRVRRGHRYPRRPPGGLGARHALSGRPGHGHSARHTGHDDGPLAQRPAHRRQVRLRLHQAVRPRRAKFRSRAAPPRFSKVRRAIRTSSRRSPRRRCSTPTSSSRSAATTAAKSLVRSTNCARPESSGRDRDGRYHLQAAKPGSTGIVGALYHDPNEGA